MAFLSKIATNKMYSFSFKQFTSSSGLRLYGQSVSTVLLIYFYTMMIHSATVSGNLEDVTADETALYFLRIS